MEAEGWQVYVLVYDFSNFQSNNFWNTISWKCSLKDYYIRSSLIECQSFLNCKMNIRPIYCVFHALCKYCARPGTFKSITSRSLWFLSIGPTDKKNTVCLSLEFWPPSNNPELMIECKLIAHPTWYMYWKKLLSIITLSCNERSIRLRPECPWRARKNNCSWSISSVLESALISSSSCQTYFPRSVRPMRCGINTFSIFKKSFESFLQFISFCNS